MDFNMRCNVFTFFQNDKNSIVQIATLQIQQLERYKEELRRQSMELEAILAGNNEENITTKGTKIKLRVANPASGVDSMVEVLNCLKKLGLKARNIRSVFSSEEFSAELEIDAKVFYFTLPLIELLRGNSFSIIDVGYNLGEIKR